MPHFDSMIQQKILLKRKLLQNQAVVNLLCNVGNNVAEFEDFKTGSKSPAEPLIKTHFYVPGTQTDDKNFITMRSRVVYTDSNVIKETGITVYIICNEHQIDLLQGSRADLLADEVDRILNNGDKPLFGLGGIKLSTADEVQFNEGYSLGDGSNAIGIETSEPETIAEKKLQIGNAIEMFYELVVETISLFAVSNDAEILMTLNAGMKRYRLLSDLDDKTLAEIDDMTLEELDFVVLA